MVLPTVVLRITSHGLLPLWWTSKKCAAGGAEWTSLSLYTVTHQQLAEARESHSETDKETGETKKRDQTRCKQITGQTNRDKCESI